MQQRQHDEAASGAGGQSIEERVANLMERVAVLERWVAGVITPEREGDPQGRPHRAGDGAPAGA